MKKHTQADAENGKLSRKHGRATAITLAVLGGAIVIGSVAQAAAAAEPIVPPLSEPAATPDKVISPPDVEVTRATFIPYRPRERKKPDSSGDSHSASKGTQQSSSMPATPVILSDNPSQIPMPINMSSEDMDDGLSADMGLGDGLGVGDLGDGLDDGFLGCGCLEGTFYDLKMKRNGKPSGLESADEMQVVEVLSKFFANWNERELSQYYRPDFRLFSSFWYLPAAKARYGPIAFEVGAPDKDESIWECKPSAWLAVYRGRVIAPKTGKFRFIGTADDFMAVRFDSKTVLEAGYFAPTFYEKANPKKCCISAPANREAFLNARRGYEMITSIGSCDKWNAELGGLVAGAPFFVREGEKYNIEIAVADISGDSVGFVLFIEDVTDGKTSQAKRYDLFRTSKINPDVDKVIQALKDAGCYEGDNRIPFNEDSWIWEADAY